MQTSKIKYVQSKLETAKLNYDCVICESDVMLRILLMFLIMKFHIG